MFQSDYYKDRRKKLVEEFQVKQKDIISKFEKDIASEGFTMVRMQVGPIIKPELLPVVDGNPVNFPQLEKLAEEGKLPKEKIKTVRGIGGEALRADAGRLLAGEGPRARGEPASSRSSTSTR